ncbi:MAG: DMT family transporter [Bacteroidales bacterium]|nr:DMT family transporter [Bacteroidales bacterium]
MNTSQAKGYLMGAIAACTYGMNPLFALPLYEQGLDANSVLLCRYVFGIFIMALMIWGRRQPFHIPRRAIGPVAVLGLLMGFSSLFLFESYTYMDAGIASTLLFVYPIMVAIIMTCVFKEKLTWLTITCVIGAFAGILCLYKGEDGVSLSPMGTLLVMLSALAYAVYLVWINRGELAKIPTVTLTFYVLTFGSVIFIFNALLHQSMTLPRDWLGWGCAVGLGLMPTAVSLFCTSIAIAAIGSTPTAILGALEPLTAVVFGVTIFHETLTGRDILGLCLIVIAVTVVIAADPISGVLLRMRKLFKKGVGLLRLHKK